MRFFSLLRKVLGCATFKKSSLNPSGEGKQALFTGQTLKLAVNLFPPLGGGLGWGLCLLLFANCLLAAGQSFPVQVVPQTLPPAPIYFSDYADASTINGPLRVQLVLNDLGIANREIRLKAYFEGNGIAFQSNDMVSGASPLYLEGGIPMVLTNAELAPYFRFENITGISPNAYGQAIPEGTYKFCFEVYDVLTGNRLSQRSCATTVVFQNEPPFLVLPSNRSVLEETNPQNIVFQWTPRSINVTNVEYQLSIVEIWDNMVDPQQAFLSSHPIFQSTTNATAYLYGPDDPLLLSGKNYAWQVRAMAKKGTEEIGLFKNQGNSEIYSFGYAGRCDLPTGLAHEVKGGTNVNIFWDDLSTDVPEYTVRYRKKQGSSPSGGGGEGDSWFMSKTTANQLTLWDLKAGTTYEYQLHKKCTVTGSDWSVPKQFTTLIADNADSVYECGISPDIALANKEPLPAMTSGEAFTAGDFPIQIREVNGSNGRFTGKGYVTIPYLNNIKVAVEFTNVLINIDRQLAEGTVVTKYDSSLKNILDIDKAIETVDTITDLVSEPFEGDNDLDEIGVNFAIPKDSVENYIKVKDGMVTITNPVNGASVSEPLGDDMVVTDSTGQTFKIDEDGNITVGGLKDKGGAVTSNNVEGVSKNGQLESLTAKDILISFKEVPGPYGFDQFPSGVKADPNVRKEYTTIKDAQGKDYILVHQAVESGKDSYIDAVVSQTGDNPYPLDSIVFKTKQGEKIPVELIDDKTVRLTLTGSYSFENETIYAVVPSKEDRTKQLTAGAFTLWHLTDRTVNVVLVSVDGAPIPDGTETTIQNIFKKGVTTINIDRKTATLDASLLGIDGKLEIGESPWLTAYNDEQKAVIGHLKSQIDYKTDKYYLFVFKDGFETTKSIAGFMPLQRQFGFLFNGGLNSSEEGKGSLGGIAAHEIGHGVFALQHPFSLYGKDVEGKTNWLMDYKDGSLLSHMDWAQLHNPDLKFYIFQDDEEGESASAEIAFENSDLIQIQNKLVSDNDIVYVSPAGIPVTLPKEAVPAFYKIRQNPITAYGVLASFSIPSGPDKGIYLGYNRGAEFTGYKISKGDEPYRFKELPDKNNIIVQSIDSGLGCTLLLFQGKFIANDINDTGTGTLVTSWKFDGPADLLRIQDQNYDTCLPKIDYDAFTDYIFGFYNYYGKGGFLRAVQTANGQLVYAYTVDDGENGQIQTYQYNKGNGLWQLVIEPSYNVHTSEDLKYLFGMLYSSEAGHLLLDMAGMAPLAGELFDAINGAWYTWEGKGKEAVLSFASTIPFVYASTAKNIGKVIKLADGTLSVIKFSETTARELAEIVNKLDFDSRSFKILNEDLADGTFAKMIAENPKLLKAWEVLRKADVDDVVRTGENGELNAVGKYLDSNPSKIVDELAGEIKYTGGYEKWTDIVIIGNDIESLLTKGIKNLNFEELQLVVRNKLTKITEKSIITKTSNAGTANQQFTSQQINRFGMTVDLNKVNPPHADIPYIGVNDFKILNKKYFIRVSGSNNNSYGEWLITLEDFNNFKSIEEIKDALALPNVPTHFSLAEIPEGTILRESQVAKVWNDGANWGNGGAKQYQIQDFDRDNPVYQSWFSNSSNLKEFFK